MIRDLGIYIHVPFCRHACPYCDFYKVELRDFPARTRLDFTAQIQKELALHLRRDPGLATQPLRTIYMGGGTPSTLSPPGVRLMVDAIIAAFPAHPEGLEVTMEANPENMTPKRCEAWREAGIRRLSMGVQSFNPDELALLERLHGPTTIEAGVRNARRAGFDNISLDLMFALPNQSFDGWTENLQRTVDLGPDHLSFYGLTWHEGTPFRTALDRGVYRESAEDLQAAMYHRGATLLADAGFEHYEISNFAKPGFRSVHNQRYWLRQDVLGLGPGAHSNVGLRRWRNPDDLDGWARSVDGGSLATVEVGELTPTEVLGERLFTMLRRREGIDRRAEPDLDKLLTDWFLQQPVEAHDWLIRDERSIRLTREGWLVSDAIIASVLAR